MKRILAGVTCILILIINLTAFAQDKTDNKSLLWKISGNGLTKPSYLFGTIHQICPDDYFWTPKMKAGLEACDKVCFEIDMNNPNMQTQVAAGLMNTDGKTLKDYFTPEQYERLKKYMMDTMNLSIAPFAQMKPVMLEMVIGLKDVMCANPIAYEKKITETANDENKEVSGLENIQEQLNVLETIPIDTVIKQLLDMIDKPDSSGGIYDKMVVLYKQQDLPALYNLIQNSNEIGNDKDAFLDARNKKWIPRMVNKMKQSTVFFAVGAGHLWGDNGVINLLRKQGYTVVPVK